MVHESPWKVLEFDFDKWARTLYISDMVVCVIKVVVNGSVCQQSSMVLMYQQLSFQSSITSSQLSLISLWLNVSVSVLSILLTSLFHWYLSITCWHRYTISLRASLQALHASLHLLTSCLSDSNIISLNTTSLCLSVYVPDVVIPLILVYYTISLQASVHLLTRCLSDSNTISLYTGYHNCRGLYPWHTLQKPAS